MAGVNPIERGKQLDILLRTLLEAGVTQTTLAFMLGVNPDTLSAHLLRTSGEGSLRIIPGTDWFSEQVETRVLIPTGSYNLGVTAISGSFTLDDARRWRVLQWNDAAGNGLELPVMRFAFKLPGASTSKFIYLPFGNSSPVIFNLILPAGDYAWLVATGAGWGTLQLSSVMQTVPIGV